MGKIKLHRILTAKNVKIKYSYCRKELHELMRRESFNKLSRSQSEDVFQKPSEKNRVKTSGGF